MASSKEVTAQFTKRAWISDRTAPVGFPSLGHFDCGCGEKVEGVKFGAPEVYTCKGCGTTYNGNGYIVEAS